MKLLLRNANFIVKEVPKAYKERVAFLVPTFHCTEERWLLTTFVRKSHS